MAVSPGVIGLVLAAACMHAVWNALVKSSGKSLLAIASIMLAGSAFGVCFLPWVPAPNPGTWPYLLCSVAIHQAYVICLSQSYRFGDLSHVYPVARGTGPLVLALLAYVFTGETLTDPALFGIGFISIGIITLGLSKKRSGIEGRALAFALSTGLLIACYTLVDGLGTRSAETALSYIVWMTVLEPLPLWSYIVFRYRPEIMPFARIHWKNCLCGGILATLAYGIVLGAMEHHQLAYVAALRETSVIFAALIGVFALHEKFGRVRICASFLVAAGVVLLHY